MRVGTTEVDVRVPSGFVCDGGVTREVKVRVQSGFVGGEPRVGKFQGVSRRRCNRGVTRVGDDGGGGQSAGWILWAVVARRRSSLRAGNVQLFFTESGFWGESAEWTCGRCWHDTDRATHKKKFHVFRGGGGAEEFARKLGLER